jgi:programmed cell death protein 5
MADSELDALRAKRLAELQQQSGQQRPMGTDHNDRNSSEEQQQKQEDMRNTMLSSLLTQEARARLNTISLTKPEKGRMVEDILIQNARRGVFGGGKVTEGQLIGLLEQVSKATEKTTKVNFDRRRAAIDSDSD